MSWQSYIDQNLLQSGFCYASIVGVDDGTTWANSPEYTVLVEEGKFLAKLLAGSSLDSIQGSGFTVAGAKYAFTRGEVDDEDGALSFLQGRCKDKGKSSQGVIIMRCEKLLIIGVHEPKYSNNVSFNQANSDIGRLADYLSEQGY